MYEVLYKTARLYSTAGMIEAPPTTQKEITEWVQKMYLSHVLWLMQQSGKDISQLKTSHVVADTPIDLIEEMPDASFPLKLEGWRYAPLFENKEYIPDINVIIAPSAGGGAWSGIANTMVIKTPAPTEKDLNNSAFIPNVLQTIRLVVEHELVHMTQTFLSNKNFGLPAREMRSTRDPYGYKRSPNTGQRLNFEQQSHSLRDIEFYPLLLQETKKLNRFLLFKSLFDPDYDKNKAIKVFVGLGAPSEDFIASKFFRKLKQYNLLKWQKAVKELVSAIYIPRDNQ